MGLDITISTEKENVLRFIFPGHHFIQLTNQYLLFYNLFQIELFIIIMIDNRVKPRLLISMNQSKNIGNRKFLDIKRSLHVAQIKAIIKQKSRVLIFKTPPIIIVFFEINMLDNNCDQITFFIFFFTRYHTK